MPSKKHEQWKRDLFNHLERKLSGCFGCEFGESRDGHAPTLRRRHGELSQEILWTCEREHPHAYDVLRGAGHVLMEKDCSAPVNGRCRPDVTILDTHGKPAAFIEVVLTNRPKKSLFVAKELGIPVFTMLAPSGRSLVAGYKPSRPWWELDPELPDDVKRRMYFMEKVKDEMMRRADSGDSTWAEFDMVVGDDGDLEFASFRGSPPDLSSPAFPRTGDLIVAEYCSWDCDKAMEMQRRDWKLDAQAAEISMRETLESDLGRILLKAIGNAGDEASRFVVSVGTEEVHVEMALKPLDSRVSPDDPVFIDLACQYFDAYEKVRNRHGTGPLFQNP